MTTKLTAVRLPNRDEKKRGAEIIFERTDKTTGIKYTILACRCYESWEQWGTTRDVLSDNCDAVERWRQEGFDGQGFEEESEADNA